MTGPTLPGSSSAAERPSDDRLDSWKEIAAYMRRDVTTVQRWEKREGMPVHRHLHDKMGSVYAFKSDLDAWSRRRTVAVVADPAAGPVVVVRPEQSAPAADPRRGPRVAWLAAAGVMLLGILAVLAVWQLKQAEPPPSDPLAHARFVPLTDFDGIEQAAAVSRDGRLVAFLSDRDGQMDVWITQIGAGQFYNLTRGAVRELANPSVRTLGFSPDGTLVTFWVRQSKASTSAIDTWAVPVLGGQPRPYLEGAAEFDWSGDGSRLVYHTPGPGDPMYVREAGQRQDARAIFSAPAGLHSHYPVWAPREDFIYFVQGSLPDHMDIWRISPLGGTPERITNHNAPVSYPVFLDQRTLLYLTSGADGSGPWIHSVDLQRRVTTRLSVGIGRYTSLAASADGRRLVATVASPKGALWRLPFTGTGSAMSLAQRIPLTTGHGSSPRLGANYLLYVASNGSGDSIWKQQGGTAAELWSAPNARVLGGPAIAADGQRVAFSVEQDGNSLLYVMNADGSGATILRRSLELRGPPVWRPDASAVTVSAAVEGIPRLFDVPLDGRPPTLLVREYAVDPAWSPDGAFVVYSGPDIGTTFEVKAVKADGSPSPMPRLMLTRGARHVAVLSKRRLIVLRGGLRHKNLWQIELDTGAEERLTDVAPDFDLRDFDISLASGEIILEQVQEHSDIVLLELPGR